MGCPRYHDEKYRKWTDAQGRPIAIEEITIRTNAGQRLLVPTETNNARIIGVLAEAKQRFDCEIYATSWLTDHGSYLVGTRDAVQRAAIMCFVHGRIGFEISRYGDFGVHSKGPKPFRWNGRVWGRRGAVIQATSDAMAVQRFKYALSNGPKEGLCRSPMTAVGVNSGHALYSGDRVMQGEVVDRTRLTGMRKRLGDQATESSATRQVELVLDKLPHLRHLSDDDYRDFCRHICHEIVDDAQAIHGAGFKPPSPTKLRNQDPRYVPPELDTSPPPAVHAESQDEYDEYVTDRCEFTSAYRKAHAELRACIRDGRPYIDNFPPGCIRPTDVFHA